MSKIRVIVKNNEFLRVQNQCPENINIYVSFDGNQIISPNDQSPQSLYLLQDKLRREENGEKLFSYYSISEIYIGKDRLSSKIRGKKRWAIYSNYAKKGCIHCEYCQLEIQVKECTIDHFIPVSRAGEDSYQNYKIACPDCNSIKGAIHPEQDSAVFNIFQEYVLNREVKSRHGFVNLVLNSSLTYKDFRNFVFNTKSSFSSEQVIFIIDKLVSFSTEEKVKELYLKNPRAQEILSSHKINQAIGNEVQMNSVEFIKSLTEQLIQ